jgi:nitrogen regulatory protein PII
MRFKLIIALVDNDQTSEVMKAARQAGATGSTVIGNARGEGISPAKTFFGLSLESQRDVVLLLVEQHLSRKILETICETAKLDHTPGTGIAFQVDVEDAVGVSHQIETLTKLVEERL